MNVNALFPSKFVAASDLLAQDCTVTIAAIKKEPVGQDEEERPVLYFAGYTKGMVLNRTNAKRISTFYGQEVEGWIGKPITLYPSETEFAGETVPCIRVRQTPPAVAAVPVAAVQQPIPQPTPQPALASSNGGRW